MENFICDDKFYRSLEEFVEDNGWYDEDIEFLSNDYSVEVEMTTLQPIVDIDAESIANCIDEERFPEDDFGVTWDKVIQVLKGNIDFEKIQSLLPKLYYGNGQKKTITKADLLDTL